MGKLSRAIVTLAIASAAFTVPLSGEAYADTSTTVSTGLPNNVMLSEQWAHPETNADTYYCYHIALGGTATDGTESYDGYKDSCWYVTHLTMNRQRTELAALENDYYLALWDLHADGTITVSPNQLWDTANLVCTGIQLAWTPDGRTITCPRYHGGFLWENVTTGQTGYVTPEALGVPAPYGSFEMVWLNDGRLLLTATQSGCTGATEWIVPMDGVVPSGPATQVSDWCAGNRTGGAVLSPDGSELAYTESDPDYANPNTRIVVSSIDRSAEHVIRLENADDGYYSHLVWSPDGRYLLGDTSTSEGAERRQGIAAISVETGAVHWVLPPQPSFDANYPTPANVPDSTPTSLEPAPMTEITAVNGDAAATTAVSGDTLTVSGSGFDPADPPTTVTVCDSTGETCLQLPAEHVVVDATGELTCTVVIPPTWTPESSTGGVTTGTPGGGQSASGMSFPTGPSAPPPAPSPGLYLSPNHGIANTTTTVGVDYLGPSQTVQIAAFASTDATGDPLSGAITATADPCGCLTTSFTVPSGAHSVAALRVDTGSVIARARWYPDDVTPPVVTGTPDRAPDSTSGWYNHPVTITWSATDPDNPASDLTIPDPTTVSVEGANVVHTSGPACDPAGNCATGSYRLSLDTTAPTISAEASRAADSNGWYNHPVDVTFTCADALSSVAGCSAPVTVNTDGLDQIVSGTAIDNAGNAASASLTVSFDGTAPSISAAPARPADSNGWYNHPVDVAFACGDLTSGVALCPDPVTVDTDGAALSVSGTSTDRAGNAASASATVKVDTTAPTIGIPTFGANPLAVGNAATVSATVADALSGAVAGEVWVDTDPGVGNATPLSLTAGTLTGTLAGISAGIHTVGVRAEDLAGNWSVSSTALLVVYDPSGGFVTGGGWITPGSVTSDAGDLLPELDGTSKANFGFTIRYQHGTSTVPTGDFEFHYNVGNLRISSTGYEWLVVTNTQWAHFSGDATINGGTNVYPIRVDARDTNKTGSPDHMTLRIYAPGANPDTDAPIYQASGDVEGGDIVIHSPD